MKQYWIYLQMEITELLMVLHIVRMFLNKTNSCDAEEIDGFTYLGFYEVVIIMDLIIQQILILQNLIVIL